MLLDDHAENTTMQQAMIHRMRPKPTRVYVLYLIKKQDSFEI